MIEFLKIVVLVVAVLVGVPFYLYVLTRWISTAVFRSYFEVKKEMEGV